MHITDKDRESFDRIAATIVVAAQQAIRNNPNLAPSMAYRLAIAYGLESYYAQLVSGLEFQVRMQQAAAQQKKADEQP